MFNNTPGPRPVSWALSGKCVCSYVLLISRMFCSSHRLFSRAHAGKVGLKRACL